MCILSMGRYVHVSVEYREICTYAYCIGEVYVYVEYR